MAEKRAIQDDKLLVQLNKIRKTSEDTHGHEGDDETESSSEEDVNLDESSANFEGADPAKQKTRCAFPGCQKNKTRNTLASLPFCRKHGGGRPCAFKDCPKKRVPEGITPFCKTHGGGRLCTHPGCKRGIQGGGLPKCRAHGGGRRCVHEGCEKSAQGGGLPLCKAHGGGRRCEYPNCTKSMRYEPGLPFCIAHGGGARCTYEGCDKSRLSGGLPFCIQHGGGKRCQHTGCNKSMRSGGLPFCRAHGGGKRCKALNCSKTLERGAKRYCQMHLYFEMENTSPESNEPHPQRQDKQPRKLLELNENGVMPAMINNPQTLMVPPYAVQTLPSSHSPPEGMAHMMPPGVIPMHPGVIPMHPGVMQMPEGSMPMQSMTMNPYLWMYYNALTTAMKQNRTNHIPTRARLCSVSGCTQLCTERLEAGKSPICQAHERQQQRSNSSVRTKNKISNK